MLSEIAANVARVIRGKDAVIEQVLCALLARGHVLLEDVPGTGKTMLARALAVSIGGRWGRVQCTPDLLPSDITGVSVFDPRAQAFEFRPGPVFHNLVLVDEINRATPRTQSALLEAMEEGQVTEGGATHALPRPFFVIATQNPIEMGGTFPLPEAQRDRFLMRLSVGYPADAVEVEILDAWRRGHPIEALAPVCDLDAVRAAQAQAVEIFVDRSLLVWIQQIVAATRRHEQCAWGASPRASLALVRCAQALALLRGEAFVTPDHVKALAHAVLEHRLVLDARARIEGATARAVVDEVLAELDVPLGYRAAAS